MLTERTVAAPAWATLVTDENGLDQRDVRGLLEDWCAEYSSTETRRKYHRNVTRFFEWIETWQATDPLDALPPHIAKYRAYLNSPHWDGHPGPCVDECQALPYAPRSVRVKVASVSSFYDYCMEQTPPRRESNPVAKERGRKNISDPPKPILMPAEFADLMNYALGIHDYRTAVILGMYGGMGLRSDELTQVRVENFGRRGRSQTLRFYRPKTRAWTVNDVPYKLTPLLERYLRDRSSGPLVISNARRTRNKDTGQLEHTGLTDRVIRQAVKNVGINSGISPDLHPHLLRHGAITLDLTDPAGSLPRVSAYHGHESIDTTMGYYNRRALLSPGHHPNPYGIDWATQVVG